MTLMTLKDQIIARIAATGPINLAEYMAECLMNPTHGYYTNRDPFGVQGDFTTAPEISQMFGELIGLCLAQIWMDQGRPSPFILAELGPGRGTLMADILRATRAVPGFCAAAQINLIETSPRLRNRQRDTLKAHTPLWHGSLDDLPEAPLFLIANEFFDALPIRQFERKGAFWLERQIGLKDGGLALGLGAPAPFAPLEHRLGDTKDGDLVEHCPIATPIMHNIGRRIAKSGGAALIVDYGDWRSLGDTLQALREHKPCSILEDPGKADLTAHVDFEHLVRDLPCRHTRLTPQGVFLERLGITARAQGLAKTMGGAALDQHIAAHRRLTHPDEMGNLFKVLGLFPANESPPPGLEP